MPKLTHAPARRKELRDLVENSQMQVGGLQKQLEEVRREASAAAHTLEATQSDLERALPFEKEVKEKNLLVGKLRHEAVILNDHLTKALRYLKKGKPEENIDKYVIVFPSFACYLTSSQAADDKSFPTFPRPRTSRPQKVSGAADYCGFAGLDRR